MTLVLHSKSSYKDTKEINDATLENGTQALNGGVKSWPRDKKRSPVWIKYSVKAVKMDRNEGWRKKIVIQWHRIGLSVGIMFPKSVFTSLTGSLFSCFTIIFWKPCSYHTCKLKINIQVGWQPIQAAIPVNKKIKKQWITCLISRTTFEIVKKR